ncbi:MAG: glutaredoxin domain-containing protein, partial [Arcobacter sp.]
MKPIALFTLPNCKWCEEAKFYFKSKKLKYNLIDLSKNKQALQDCQKHCS